MASSPFYNVVVIAWAVLTVLLVSRSKAMLSSDNNKIYPHCPNVLDIVRNVMQTTIQKDVRMGASLLRLHFHDCFVNGCDGSVLLDDTASVPGEKLAAPNKNSARGFEVVDEIKSGVEKFCPGMVSCADILAIAARDAVDILSGGNCIYEVELGRLDSFTASQAAANTSIPLPTFNISALISNFNNHSLSKGDLVTLSGGHTIGLARCTNFKSVIYNETNTVDQKFAKELQKNCPQASSTNDNNTAPLDKTTPFVFDNAYYSNIIKGTYLLHSDHQLLNDRDTSMLVHMYSKDLSFFYEAFGKAMLKMGALDVLVQGKNKGEIRKECRKRNGNNN